jgi:hypothetical protein
LFLDYSYLAPQTTYDMLPIEKIKPAVLLSLGKREEARRALQDTYRVSDEEAEKLVAALAAESPLPQLSLRKIIHYAGVALTVFGVITTGVGVVGYFSFSTPEMEWAHVPCTVSATNVQADGVTSVTFVYAYKGKGYAITDVSRLWQSFGLRQGQVLDMLVNPENPEDTRLPIAKPILQQSTKNIAITGLVILAFAVALWAFTRYS